MCAVISEAAAGVDLWGRCGVHLWGRSEVARSMVRTCRILSAPGPRHPLRVFWVRNPAGPEGCLGGHPPSARWSYRPTARPGRRVPSHGVSRTPARARAHAAACAEFSRGRARSRAALGANLRGVRGHVGCGRGNKMWSGGRNQQHGPRAMAGWMVKCWSIKRTVSLSWGWHKNRDTRSSTFQ